MGDYDAKKLASLLPFPPQDAHKYSRGTLIMFAGSSRYPGAALLSAWASQRAGAGYTQVFTVEKALPLLQAARPSLVVRSDKELSDSDFIVSKLGRPCAYMVGSGFEAGKKRSFAITSRVLKMADAPVLLDGGALHALTAAENQTQCALRKQKGLATLITPHYGEAMALAQGLGLAKSDPMHLAYDLALSCASITVVKGPESFISDGEKVFSISLGSPALAKAGTGDVLAGMIGAFLAQGIEAFDAAMLGVSVHARAGCQAENKLTSIAVSAEDVIEFIPAAFKELMGS